MNFFEHQDEARRRTALLVFLFAVAVVCIIVTTYLAISVLLTVATKSDATWSWETFVLIGAGVTVLVAGASGFKILSLQGSGVKVAEMMGGRVVNNLSDNPAEQRLVNVVEEMAIASGVAVPLVFVLDQEEGINAFAAGHGPEDAVVAVTAGALKAFSRDELQGVIAHEFSHILNRDVRLNTRLTGLLFGILVIALTGRIILQTMGRGRVRSSNGKGGGGIAVVLAVGLTLMVVGYIGLFFGKLIKQAVSRQREYLADASAVQFTRNPDGLASALKRIAGWTEGSQLHSANAEEISHFFFADGMKPGWLSSMLSTHPPLADRIKRLDPQFDGSLISAPTVSASLNDDAQISALTDNAQVAATAQSVVGAVGTTEPERFFYDDAMVTEIPNELRKTISSALGAIATVYALVLDSDKSVRALQLDILAGRVDKRLLNEISSVLPLVASLDHFARLPTIDLAMPALRTMSSEQFVDFAETLDVLVSTDKHLSLFEFAVRAIITSRLSTHFGRKVSVGHRVSRDSLRTDSIVLVSALARIGQKNPEDVETAFRAGMERFGPDFAGAKLERPDASAIERAISRLGQVPYPARQTVVDACAHCVLSDEEVTIDEAELLRAVIVSLGCTLPPFLPRLS